MSETVESTNEKPPVVVPGKFQEHRILAMIIGAICITFILVIVAMGTYINSTAIELDLSRPAYQSVRDQVSKDMQTTSFPSTGEIDEAAAKAFRQTYSDQYDKAAGVNGFGSEALTDEALVLPEIQ